MDTSPQVIKTDLQLSPLPWWKKKIGWIVSLFLIFIITVELIWGVYLFRSGNQITLPAEASTNIETVSPQIVVFTPKSNYQVGEIIPVVIKVVTGGNPTDSADLILKFDPAKLTPETKFFELGQIYSEYPVAEVNQDLGFVQVSATTALNQTGFTGIGELVKLSFKAKSAGQTDLQILFSPNLTSESNLVLSGTTKDILTQVVNADLMIGSQSLTANTSGNNSCSGFYQFCQIGEKAGKQYCQSGSLKNNLCTFDPLLTVSCSECQLQ